MKKILSLFTLISVLLIGFSATAFADSAELSKEINRFAVNGSEAIEKELNGTYPYERKVLEVKEVDGNMVTIYEDLPDQFTVNSPQNSLNGLIEGDISPSCATCNQKVYTKLSSWTESSDYNFGWHPGFSGYNRASGYWFSTTKVSFGVSVTYGFLSVSINQAGGNGYYVSSNYDKWSRPAVFGVYDVTKYKVDEYNPAGIFIRTYTEHIPSASNTYIKVLYQ